MVRRRSEDVNSDDLWKKISAPSRLAATLFWFIIWALSGFEPWVGFGLFFAWAASIGLFGGSDRRRDDDEEDDDRGFQARRGGEPVATPSAPPPLLHRRIIADAKIAKAQLEAAASVGDGALGAHLRKMVAKVAEVEAGLEMDASRLADVQRLFTYYLPATATLLSARGAALCANDLGRLAEIDRMIAKLDVAYTDFAARLKGHDVRSLEIDLRLLDRSLDEEFDLSAKR
jgi:hypothetical protein